MNRLFAATLALLAFTAAAQSPPPEMPSEMPVERPAPSARPAPPKAAPAPAPAGGQQPVIVNEVEGAGTTLVGDRESPIGLYLIPWRGSTAETGLDRPARLLDDALLPLDPDVFHRQVIYSQALTEHLHQAGRVTPK